MARTAFRFQLNTVGPVSYTVPALSTAVFKAISQSTGSNTVQLSIGGVIGPALQADTRQEVGPLTANAADVISASGVGTAFIVGFLYT